MITEFNKKKDGYDKDKAAKKLEQLKEERDRVKSVKSTELKRLRSELAKEQYRIKKEFSGRVQKIALDSAKETRDFERSKIMQVYKATKSGLDSKIKHVKKSEKSVRFEVAGIDVYVPKRLNNDAAIKETIINSAFYRIEQTAYKVEKTTQLNSLLGQVYLIAMQTKDVERVTQLISVIMNLDIEHNEVTQKMLDKIKEVLEEESEEDEDWILFEGDEYIEVFIYRKRK
jgi:hypothetical protein